MSVNALTGKVRFQNNKTQYRVEVVLSGTKAGWKQHFKTLEEAIAEINERKANQSGLYESYEYLITEVTTRTIGLL